MKLKLPKLSTGMTTLLIAFLVTALVVLAVGIIFLPDPLDAYITRRNCQFIQYGALSAASCSDGTNWTISEVQP